jgi:Icc-related predicted phosphoesterase
MTVLGLKIYGSPITPRFYNWAFMADRGNDIAGWWAAIPDDTDILVTHGPPHGIGDLVRGRHTGCLELLKRVHEVKPTLHVFGHIHEGYGIYQSEEMETIFANAAHMDGDYSPVNPPLEFTYNV